MSVMMLVFVVTNEVDGNVNETSRRVSTTTPLSIEYNVTEFDEWANYTDEEYQNFLIDYIKPKKSEWVFIAMHSVVFIIGLIGNALVCVAVYR